MINHIYVFGPPGTEKTRQIVEENAEKFDTTWNEEWLRLVHGLFDEMENPFLTRNVVQTLSEEFFEGKAQVDVRCHTQVFKGQAYPAVKFSLFDDRGPLAGQSRASQSQRSREGRAPVSRDQVPVRFHQGPLQRAGQEYGAADDAVCAEQCVDGAKTFAGCKGMSARAQRASARKRPEKGLQNSPNALNFGEIAIRVSLDELLNLNARCGGSYADLP